jgi:hypothetical protein
VEGVDKWKINLIVGMTSHCAWLRLVTGNVKARHLHGFWQRLINALSILKLKVIALYHGIILFHTLRIIIAMDSMMEFQISRNV